MVAMRKTIGLVEEITLLSEKEKKVKARIDTGAKSNSIDKKLADSLNLGPATKTTLVRSANGQSLRPVLNIDIILAGKRLRGRFTIADRKGLKYRVLIGRNILEKSGFLIDPSK